MIKNNFVVLFLISFLSCHAINSATYLYNKHTGHTRILIDYTDTASIKSAIKLAPDAKYYYAFSTNQSVKSVDGLKDALLIKSNQTIGKLLQCFKNNSCNNAVSMSDLYKDLLAFLKIVEIFESQITNDLLLYLEKLKEQFLSDFNLLSAFVMQGLVSADLAKIIQQSADNPLVISSLQATLKEALKLPCLQLKKKLSIQSCNQLINLLKNEFFGIALIYMQILWASEQKDAPSKIIFLVEPQWIDDLKMSYIDLGYAEYDKNEIDIAAVKVVQIL